MKYLFLLFIALSTFVSAQDETLSIVSYNLLNFPDGRDDCGAANVVVENRGDTLRKITDYLQPDILAACEVQNQAGVDAVLNKALNVGGATNYAAADFNLGRGDLFNALFYNTDKLTLLSQHVVTSYPRDIDHYILYLKDPNLAVYYDTTFIEVFMTHLKAGNSTSSEASRATQTQILMDYIATRPADRNIFVGGDMNVYSSNDDGYRNMITGANALKDPINQPGNWNDSSFSSIHTQSTRTSPFLDCGASGGMDDRFDQLLVSQNVMNNTDNVVYQTGSYRAVGQDGNQYDNTLIANANTMYPQSLVNALYYMSDHLPVELKVDVTYPTENGLALVPSYSNVSCNEGADGTATITPNLGVAPFTYLWDANAGSQTTQTATGLGAGTHCVTVTDDLGEVDSYCITIGEPDAMLFSSFITPDNSGDCLGGIQLIIGGGVEPYSYSWTEIPSNTSSSASNLCMGNYEIIVSDVNGCELVINRQVGGIAGLVSETNEGQLLQLYPNPAKEKLIIHAEMPIQEIKVLTITGREMILQSTQVKENLIELDRK